MRAATDTDARSRSRTAHVQSQGPLRASLGVSSTRTRLAWLTDVAAATTPAPALRRPDGRFHRSDQALGRALAAELGTGRWWAWVGRIARARAGGPAHPALLRALARLLGAPEDFFTRDAAALAEAMRRVVDDALAAEVHPTHVRRCRAHAAVHAPATSPLTQPSLAERVGVLHALRLPDTNGPVHIRPGLDRAARGVRGGSVRPHDLTLSGATVCQDDYATQPTQHTASSGVDAERRQVIPQLGEHDLEEFCARLVHDLEVTLPLDPAQLCRRLAHRRGRPIRRVAADLGGPHSIGHLIALPDRDTIFYDAAAPRALQDQVICHEVMHLARGHLDDQAQLTCGALLPREPTQPADGFVDAGSGPGEDLGLYAEWQEWEAEFGATLLVRLTHVRPAPSRPPSDTEAGLAAAFGLQPAADDRTTWRTTR